MQCQLKYAHDYLILTAGVHDCARACLQSGMMYHAQMSADSFLLGRVNILAQGESNANFLIS